MASDFEISRDEARRTLTCMHIAAYRAKQAQRKTRMYTRQAGRFMAELRKTAGVSRAQLADALGVSRADLRNWEEGNAIYPRVLAERVGRALVDWHTVNAGERR